MTAADRLFYRENPVRIQLTAPAPNPSPTTRKPNYQEPNYQESGGLR